jgi:hypothetical protein
MHLFNSIKNYISSLILILFIVIPHESVLAGAWPQKKGGGYYKISFRYLSGEKIYNSDGVKIPIPKFTDYTLGLFGSYGLTDKLTAFMNVGLFRSTKLDTSSQAFGSDTDVSGFGDISVGLKYGIVQLGKTIISAKLIFGIPTGLSSPDGGLWLGSGNANQLIGLEAGHSFWPSGFYLTEGIAFNNQTNGFSNQFRYYIEGGYRFSKSLLLIARLHGLISFDNGDPNVLGGFGSYQNDQQFLAYNAELVYSITDHWGVSAYYESGTNGKNIISAPVLNFSVFFTH